jgi:hypothetical protein
MANVTQEQEDDIKTVGEEWRQLIRETIRAGHKITILDVVNIWRLSEGKTINGTTIVWLEKGDLMSGVVHILDQHIDELLQKGITEDELGDVAEAATVVGLRIGRAMTGQLWPLYTATSH